MYLAGPNWLDLVVSVSFVCESNDGFVMSALTNTNMDLATMNGRTLRSLNAFSGVRPCAIALVTYCTCCPPLVVHMELQKLTCSGC